MTLCPYCANTGRFDPIRGKEGVEIWSPCPHCGLDAYPHNHHVQQYMVLHINELVERIKEIENETHRL